MKKTPIAKISRPNAQGIIPRKRLFRLLDNDNAGKHQILWVTGPAGSGKTSLIASYLDARKLPCLWYQADDRDSDIASFFYYLGLATKKAAPRYRKPLPLLTPEYLGGVATFTQRFFENLYSRLKPPFAVVFDNYQDVPEASPLHDVVRTGLELAPDGIQVIVLSRKGPPTTFTRLRANNAIGLVGWEELRLTPQETKQFIGRKMKLAEKVIAELHVKTEGWVAGLVLLMENAGKSPDGRLHPAVFDYFAGEVFDKLDNETREFLLATAFLPTLTAQAAEKITARKNAGAILAALHRNNFFTVKISGQTPAYRFHPLFRAFLQTRLAETMSRESASRLREKAAGLLLEDGRIEEAAEQLFLAEDWKALVALILGNARTLITQGRNRTLREWLEKIPAHLSSGNPWLLFWSGVCNAPFDPAGSRPLFERALRLFETAGNEAGALVCWSSIVQSILIEFHDFRPLDPWIEWINDRIRHGVAFASPDIEASVVAGMTGILAWRRTDLPDRKKWLDRALTLPQSPAIADVRMRACTNSALYHLWMGEFSQCRFLIHEMRAMLQSYAPSPLRRIILNLVEAMFYNAQAGCHDRAVRAVTEGLNLAQEAGVSLMSPSLLLQGSMSSLNEGGVQQAWEFLRKLEPLVNEDRRLNLSHYFFMAAWCELYAGAAARACDFAKRSLSLIEATGAPTNETLIRLAYAHALYECGDYSETRAELDKIKELVRQTGSAYAGYLSLLTEAFCALDRDDRSSGLAALASALETGRRNDFTTMVYFWRPSVMSRLCAEALEAGIEAGYAQNLIRKLRLVPDERARDARTWAWPLRVRTLGKFELLKDDELARAASKVQHKPLMLLKVLIAFGGREVPEERIADLLWPESDGDAAHSAFSTTLQRLRALVGNDKALLLDGRRLTLDERFCWVDAWAFERMHERAEEHWRGVQGQPGGKKRGTAADDAFRQGEQALELYQGSFLPGDAGQVWTAAYRERLRSKFLRLVLRQGLYHEKAAEWRKAAATFERGLETDELAEEFYQHLMMCYQKNGQKAEAIRIYDACRAVLFSAFGITPSQKTETLYSQLLK